MRILHPYPAVRARALVATIVTVLLASCSTAPQTVVRTVEDPPELKEAVLQRIALHYFATPKIDSTLTSRDIVDNLDPFSEYLTEAEYDSWMGRLDEREISFGFYAHAVNGRITITSVEPGSTADDAGMLPGDEIESAARVLLMGSEARFERALRRSPGSVEFVLRRATQHRPVRIKIERAECPSTSVPICAMLDSTTGYVLIVGFHRGTANRLRLGVKHLVKRGARSLVIDLRDNPGGLVAEALNCANLFIHCDSAVLTGHSRIAEQNWSASLPGDALYPTMPLAVLVDGGSASASELFSGILQDLSRATIIGQPTLGKGMVMGFYDLYNGDQLYLAVSEYDLPSGRCIQRSYHGATLSRNTQMIRSQTNFNHALDSALAQPGATAYQLASGRKVYGGEGIVPDIIIAENEYPTWLGNSIWQAEVPYLHRNADGLLDSRLDNFDKEWTAPASLVETALAESRSHDTSAGKKITANVAKDVPTFIKWYLAYCIWGERGTFAVWTRHKEIIKRAVEELHQITDGLAARATSTHTMSSLVP